jgi:large conductance mechanosensitive channel
MSLLNDFKAFVLRGNVIDLAVAVVIGAAFKSVVDSLVADIVTPIIAAIVGKPDFAALTFTIHDSTFRYGSFINALISFLLIAAAVFFFIVVPMNQLLARTRKEPPPDPTIKKCPDCLSSIPAAALRCAYCTTPQTAAA